MSLNEAGSEGGGVAGGVAKEQPSALVRTALYGSTVLLHYLVCVGDYQEPSVSAVSDADHRLAGQLAGLSMATHHEHTQGK